jgi:AAHS family 4-hydroxybenzoate transporter-like MFS transporter
MSGETKGSGPPAAVEAAQPLAWKTEDLGISRGNITGSPTVNVQDVIESNKVGRGQWLIVTLCAMVMFLDGFDTQVVSYIAPVLAKQWHFSPEILGSIFSATFVGLMIGYLAISPLSVRFGHKRMMVFSTILFAFLTFLTMFATNATELICLRLLTGIGLGAAAPSAVALTCEFAPKRLRATFVLIIYCGFSLGFVVAGFASGAVLPNYGWEWLLGLGAAAPLALAVPLLVLLPESVSTLKRRSPNDQHIHQIMARLFPNADLQPGVHFTLEEQDEQRPSLAGLFEGQTGIGTFLLWGVFFINLAVFYFMQSWLPTMLTAMHFPMSTVVWVTALPTIAGILAALPVGLAMDRVGPYTTLTAMYVAGGVFMFCVAGTFSAQPWMLMVAIFCAGFCISGGQKSVIALAAIYYSRNLRSTGVGWALGIGRLGGIAGPLIVGMMYSAQWTPVEIFQLASLPVFVAGIGVFIMGRLDRPRRAVPVIQT